MDISFNAKQDFIFGLISFVFMAVPSFVYCGYVVFLFLSEPSKLYDQGISTSILLLVSLFVIYLVSGLFFSILKFRRSISQLAKRGKFAPGHVKDYKIHHLFYPNQRICRYEFVIAGDQLISGVTKVPTIRGDFIFSKGQEVKILYLPNDPAVNILCWDGLLELGIKERVDQSV